jgi:hypothetical protein
MSEFRFDPISFIIGFVVASGLALLLYRLRHWLGQMRQEAQVRAESARRFATRTADARYQIDIRNHCQQYHLAGDMVDLSEIVIEPRFIPGIDIYDTTGERNMQEVFRVIPMIHKFPAAYGPYNIKTVGISDLAASARHLALLGRQGSGRSTALATIALWAMGEVEFVEMEDLVQQAIEAEEAELDDKQREARRKERAEIQTRALEQIANAQEQARKALGEDADPIERIDFTRLMPILVHFSDIQIDPDVQGRIDPAEPLVEAVQHNLRRITALTVPRYIYNRLNVGQALVLLDGLDDLPPAEQSARLAWLDRFMASYPDCVVIVTGPATGYHPLQQMGFAPMFIRPWMDISIEQYVTRWAAAWPEAARQGRQIAPAPDEHTIRKVTEGTRGMIPMDVTARVLATFTNPDEEETLNRWDWYTALATRNFHVKEFEKDKDLQGDALYTVAQIAAETIAQGSISGEQLREHVENNMRRVEGEGNKATETFALDVNRFLKMLTASSGLMVERAGDCYTMSHPLLAGFLASVPLIEDENDRTLDQVANDPVWQHAIPFAAMQAPVDMMNRTVYNKLTQQPDLLFDNLLDIAHWIPDTPGDAPWKGEIFKRLAAALIAPTQFPMLRQYALAALVTTRDRNVLFILRQALRSTNTDIRLLGCIGLGVIGESDAIKDLRPMLEDEVIEVQLAAGLALGAIGTERAIEVMVDGLLNGEENLRQAVAEALAAIPGEGHEILHTAATSEEMI